MLPASVASTSVGPQADATEPAEPIRRASRRSSRLDGCRQSCVPTCATRGHIRPENGNARATILEQGVYQLSSLRSS